MLDILINDNNSFKNKQEYLTGKNPVSLTSGDFNNDGLKDILVANNGENNLSLFINSSKERVLREPLPINVPGQPYWTVSADLNYDENLDFVTALKEDKKIIIYFGEGNGTFIKSNVIKLKLQPSLITLGDINNDYLLDIVVANKINSTINILFGNENGEFRKSAQRIKAAGIPRDITLAHLNNDCNLDIVTANDTNNISVLRGSGDGTFEPSVEFSFDDEIVSVLRSDTNKDLKDDLIVATKNKIYVLVQEEKN